MKFRECYGMWTYVRYVKTLDMNVVVDLAKVCHILYRINYQHVRRVTAIDEIMSGATAADFGAYTRVVCSILGSSDSKKTMNILRRRARGTEHQTEIDWDAAARKAGV